MANPFSKRSGLNAHYYYVNELHCIDHARFLQQYGPYGTTWDTGTVWSSAILDDEGYPKSVFSGTWSNPADARKFGGGFGLPNTSDFNGPYVLDWEGDGEINLEHGTWTVVGTPVNCSQVSSGKYAGASVGAVRSRVVLTNSGITTGTGLSITRTDRSNTGAYIKRWRFYRLEDEADLIAGKSFRDPWKQNQVDEGLSFYRLMNWCGTNNSHGMRFEHRALPDYATWSGVNWNASPPYQETTGTNAIVLASATGMPVAMQHGEIVACRTGNSIVRAGAVTVTGITKANPGVVTYTGTNHPSNGDKIVFDVTTGMMELLNATNRAPKVYTVANVNTGAHTFELSGINTSAFTTWTSGVFTQHITLNVGARGAYPVVFEDGLRSASYYGAYIGAQQYKCFYFDKNSIAADGVTGAYIFNNLGTMTPHAMGVPLEICAKLILELNEMSDKPIHLWMTRPHRGLSEMDPDYDEDSDYGIQSVDVLLNGANGYDGLKSINGVDLIDEDSNEDWNFGGTDFSQTGYRARQGFLRWPASGSGDNGRYSTLRKVVNVEAIKAAHPGELRVKFVMCGQGTGGTLGNSTRIYGGTYYDTDVLNVWGDDPIDHYHAFGFAGYFEAGTTFDNANLATMATNWFNAVGAAANEAVCAQYVVGVVGSNTGETTSRYANVLAPEYAAAMVAKGKVTIMYEGGWNRPVNDNFATHSDDFLKAVKRSQAWADAFGDFLDTYGAIAGAYMPSDYILLNPQWGHLDVDPYYLAAGGEEWSGLDLAWDRIAEYNADAPSDGLVRFRLGILP